MGEPLIKVNKNKFEMEHDRIAIYPDLQVKVVFYVISVFMAAMLAGCIYVGIKFNTLQDSLPIIIINALVMLLLIIFGGFLSSKKIVFDKAAQEVYSILGPFKKHLIHFSEIHDINKNNSLFTGIYYRIQPKNDLVGNGIKISAPYTDTITQQERAFTTDVLPRLKEMVFSATTSVDNITVKNHPPLFTSFVHFKTTDNNTYEYRPVTDNIYLLVYSAAMIALVYCCMRYIPDDIAKGKPSWGAYAGLLFLIGGCIFGIYRNTQKTILDKTAKTVTQSNFFGVIRYTYPFQDFEKYKSVKHYINGIYTGTDLEISFRNNKYVKVENKYNTQKIHQLIDELDAIIFK